MSGIEVHSANWRKSSYSGDSGGQCVELADLGDRVGVRDSKDPEGGVLVVTRRTLLNGLRDHLA
ncbi:DUF397 domain-containing protein [Spirillospora sp. NPDC048911]|uniref:DUF397 domain-containing protein n=1 Tax=Spirillospora sp. NPDC048911 TaxID=3364527 RepID=UPI003711047F